MVKKCIYFIHNIWAAFWFISIYLVLFPFIFIGIQYKPWHKYANKITNLWADLFFIVAFMPVKIEYKGVLDPRRNYVFVANHFSFFDVAVGMKVVRHYFSYMGKASVKKIPLLGYMFAKLHIQVDRLEKDSRAKALLRSQRALIEGRSLFIMPEGGILSENIPKMHQPFKDGAFNLAKEAGLPIVPITFLNLYNIMPFYSIKWGIPSVIVNRAIETKGKELEELKQEVYSVIQNQLDHYHKLS
jgi:1-acyl-sn-glycerol-3-phosphate acyltransferase